MALCGKMFVANGTPTGMYLGDLSNLFLFDKIFLKLKQKQTKAEKKKSGFQNKIVALLALYHCGELDRLQQEMTRMLSWHPLQEQLHQVVSLYQHLGVAAFQVLGYLPWKQG